MPFHLSISIFDLIKMKHWNKILLILLLTLTFFRCKDRYDPPVISAPNSFLVVEGFINAGDGPTSFHLTRTAKLDDTSHIRPESSAIVTVENEAGTEVSHLSDKGNGEYSSDQLNINPAEKYLVRIRTNEGKEYVSDLLVARSTPKIDSVYWRYDNDGLKIYANTHDPSNNSRYYKWNYSETWEFHSAFISSLIYENGRLIPRPVPSLTYTCWQSLASTSIIINNTAGLSGDVVNLQPINFIPRGSDKVSVKYSILVTQQTITKEAYQYLLKMKKNSEELGTIFDPQPSELKGNIHCVTVPNELVVGYLYSSSVKQKRIFVSNIELPDWNYFSGCTSIFVPPDSLEFYFGPKVFWPIEYVNVPGRGDGVSGAVRGCIDCTMFGTNIKPSFWP
ncbi:MAG: DUF4249 domain-containing protein [Bacteroidetes bacterium]|nr:MAG: DUF4249 domain-containing protein [Bacteroidota bacterium]